MCDKPNPRRIDPCMRNLVEKLNSFSLFTHEEVVACCCGHGRYPMTIVMRSAMGNPYEIVSDTRISRKARFYVRDKDGYFYIPETLNKA